MNDRDLYQYISSKEYNLAFKIICDPVNNDLTTEQCESILSELPTGIDPNDDLSLLLAALYLRIGNEETALQSLLNYTCLDKFDTAGYLEVLKSPIFVETESFLLHYIERALRKFPSEPSLLWKYAQITEQNGDLSKAVLRIENACKENPDNLDLYLLAARINLKRSDHYSAGNYYKIATYIDPTCGEAVRGAAECFRYSKQFALELNDYELIFRFVSDSGIIRPESVCQQICTVFKSNQNFLKNLNAFRAQKTKETIINLVKVISENKVFNRLLVVTPIHDLEIELILTELRFYFLFSSDWFIHEERYLKFFINLCIQCQINEFIYYQTEKEIDHINNIVQRIEPKALSWLSMLKVSFYRQIIESKIFEAFKEEPLLKTLKAWLVEYPEYENELKSSIPSLGSLDDTVSRNVALQYENYPYPRWVTIGSFKKNATFSDVIKSQGLEVRNYKSLNCDNPSILIAGCGTGRHAIDTSNLYQNAEITALDLSYSSLAYAKRKTIEAKINNINYIQGDILSLENIDKKFDIVESVGVLHHMHDPKQGLMVLVDKLNPSGLIRLGLYSRRARSQITSIRDQISKKGVVVNEGFVREFRRLIALNSSQSSHDYLIASQDFYSMSSVKDLLFHEQEHSFSLDEIKELLSQCSLKFCGFQDKVLLNAFQNYNGSVNGQFDLTAWDIFEEKFPFIFGGMYQFWCQKVDES